MIAHIVLNISNYEVSKKFYDTLFELLGFSIAFEIKEEWGSTTSYRKETHNIWIKWEANNEHHNFVRDVGLDHIAFLCLNKEQVDNLYSYIQSTGYKITRPPRNYPEYNTPYYAFYFRDPDGIPLEVVWK